MMEFFEYLRNISYYLVFMAFVGVIAPSGNYKKYITLVMGIMLIGITIYPVVTLLGRESVPLTSVFGNITPAGGGAFAQGQHDYLREAFHAQLTMQTESLLAGNGFGLTAAEWESADDLSHIKSVRLQVIRQETPQTRQPFVRIEPVRIAPYQPAPNPDALIIKNILSDFYGIHPDNIHVEILESTQ